MRVWMWLAGGLLATACGAGPEPVSPLPSDDRTLPDYRPETAALCNSVGLSITYGPAGVVIVNGLASNMDGLLTAARAKNAVCANAPAVVNLTLAPGLPESEADGLRTALAAVIRNLALSEAD